MKSAGLKKIDNTSEGWIAALNDGAVMCAVYADNAMMQYSEGIYDTMSTGVQPNHAVTAVGWGEKDGKKYVVVKNSWGSDWGENGYICITMGGASTFFEYGYTYLLEKITLEQGR